MKLILIFPDFEIFSHLDQGWLQFGLAHLYTETKKAGFEVEYLDGRFIPLEKMQEKIETDKEITHIGINVLSVYRDNARNLLKFIGEKRPDIKRIIGGVHVTSLPDEFIGRAEYIVKGEGEKLLLEILRGNVKEGISEGRIENLDELEYVDRSIIPVEESPITGNLPKPFVTLMNSRACPSQCKFCAPASQNIFGKKYKFRSVENIIGEIKELVALKGIKSFHMNDDNFMVNKKYIQEFCKEIKPFDLKWSFQGRANTICDNPELIEEMADAGASTVLVGFESGSDRLLKWLNKGATLEQNLNAANILHDNDMVIFANIMVGLPTEQPHEVLETIMMVEDMMPDLVSICTFTPMPGSYLYDYCKEHKLMPDNIDQSYFNRGKFEEKIKGVDYRFLSWAIQRMCDICYNGMKL